MRDFYYFCTRIVGWEDFYEPLHRPLCEWFAAIPPTRFRQTLIPRGHFKCLPRGTPVQVADGRYLPVEDLVRGDTVHGLTPDFRPALVPVWGTRENPAQPCVAVHLRSGRVLRASANHPVLQLGRWTAAGGLVPGDRIAILNHFREPENAAHLPYAAILGWMLGDGCFPLQRVTNTDPRLRQEILHAARLAGAEAQENYRPERAADVSLRGLRPLWRELGLLDCRAQDKFVPPAVFTADDASVRVLLRALYAADGCFSYRQGIVLTTVSPALARDVVRLLRRFRIQARAKRFPSTEGLQVHVSGGRMVRRFDAEIGWLKPKCGSPVTDGPDVCNTVPAEWRTLLPEGARTYRYGVDNKYATTKPKLQRIAEALDDPLLLRLADDDVVWDFVEEVTVLGDLPTVDLEVEGGVFAADDVVTHNTTVGTECQIMWRWLWDPTIRFLISHGKLEVASQALSTIRFNLESNDKLKFIGPDIFYANPEKESPRWLKDAIDIKRPKYHRVASCTATGATASVVGLHFDWLIFDDLVYDENIGTIEQLDKVKNYIRAAGALLRVPAKGKIDIIGTRWHIDDAYGWMLREVKSSLTAKTMSCWTPEGVPIFPSRYSKEDLIAKKEEMGSFLFSALYENNPVPSDMRYFREEDVQFIQDLPKDKPLRFFTAVDPNREEGIQHHPGAVVTFARDPEGNYYEAEITHRRFNVDDLVAVVRWHVQTWNPEKVIVESTGGQTYLIPWLRKEQIATHAPYTLVPVARGPQAHKPLRILRIQPIVERKQLFLRTGFNPLFDELRVYLGRKDDKDDCLDALADIVQLGYDPKAQKALPEPRSQFQLEQVIARMHHERKVAENGIQPWGRYW